MPVLIQVDGDQRTSSYPTPHSHLWFHQICNRTPYKGFLIHPLNHQGQNPLLQSKCVLKILSLTAALEKICMYLHVYQAWQNEFFQSFLIRRDCINRKNAVWLVIFLSRTRKDRLSDGYHFQVLLSCMNDCITSYRQTFSHSVTMDKVI